jgi:RNA polymerase sigma-70 factor (ECF subfamily)
MIRVMEQERQVQAVQRLFVAHTSLLKGFILGLLPDYNRAEDVLQEVFLTLTQKADEFQPGTDFTAWARAVARIKVLHRFDQDKRAPRPLCAEALDALVAAAPAMDETRSSRRHALGKCLEESPPRPGRSSICGTTRTSRPPRSRGSSPGRSMRSMSAWRRSASS